MDDEIHPDVRAFIDRVIVPALLERFLRDEALVPVAESQRKPINRQRIAEWQRVKGKWINRAG
jgi:hypothetical protein